MQQDTAIDGIVRKYIQKQPEANKKRWKSPVGPSRQLKSIIKPRKGKPMSIQKLADNLYIAPQLTEADVQEAAKLGIQTVICNRPNGEEENQVTFKQVESWLEAAGIREHHHQPVVAPAINAADVAAFQNLLKSVPQPVLAYCRTGTRCSLLWGYHQVQNGASVAEVVAAAQQAGVNLSNFEARLQQASEHGLN